MFQSWHQNSCYTTTWTRPSLTWGHIAMCGLLWMNLLSNLGPLARDRRYHEAKENLSWKTSITRLWWLAISSHTCMQQSWLLSGWASWSPQNKSLHFCTLQSIENLNELASLTRSLNTSLQREMKINVLPLPSKCHRLHMDNSTLFAMHTKLVAIWSSKMQTHIPSAAKAWVSSCAITPANAWALSEIQPGLSTVAP